MTSRRRFLNAAGGFGLGSALKRQAAAQAGFTSRRPAAEKRRFRSEAVETVIQETKKSISDPAVAWLFENCYPNTLDTTVVYREVDSQPDTFVITGDINAMWLRDSAAQVWPYLRLARQDRKLQRLLLGVVNRQTRCILIDPYANAFNAGPTGSAWAKDLTQMKPELHERKWEIDSLCYAVRLAHGYWKSTGDASCFSPEWKKAAGLIVQTFREQQRLTGPGPYRFQRVTAVPTDSLPNGGLGNPAKPCGLIHSGFRPSDDACIFPFLVASNFFAVTSLEQLAEIHSAVLSDGAFARQCGEMAGQVRQALNQYAKVTHPVHGEIFAYEVDAYGSCLMMDDCGIPGLTSMPYLGAVPATDPVYRNTRNFALSESNPFFYRGSAGEGLGSPHSGLNMIWPMGIIARALTSTSAPEVRSCLATIKTTNAGTGFMHEAFSKNDASKFTRPWFAWANTLYGELILSVLQSNPQLLRS